MLDSELARWILGGSGFLGFVAVEAAPHVRKFIKEHKKPDLEIIYEPSRCIILTETGHSEGKSYYKGIYAVILKNNTGKTIEDARLSFDFISTTPDVYAPLLPRSLQPHAEEGDRISLHSNESYFFEVIKQQGPGLIEMLQSGLEIDERSISICFHEGEMSIPYGCHKIKLIAHGKNIKSSEAIFTIQIGKDNKLIFNVKK